MGPAPFGEDHTPEQDRALEVKYFDTFNGDIFTYIVKTTFRAGPSIEYAKGVRNYQPF